MASARITATKGSSEITVTGPDIPFHFVIESKSSRSFKLKVLAAKVKRSKGKLDSLKLQNRKKLVLENYYWLNDLANLLRQERFIILL